MPPIQYAESADGTRIAYCVIPGESPPLLYVSAVDVAPGIDMAFRLGFRSSFLEALAGGRAMVLYDPRGRGFSGRITKPLTIEQMVEDLDAVTESVGEPVRVVAGNTGASVACVRAARDPRLWTSLYLMGPAATFAGTLTAINGWDVRKNYRTLLGFICRVVLNVSLDDLTATIDQFERETPVETAIAYDDVFRHFDIWDLLPRIELPTHVSIRMPAVPGGVSEHAKEVASLIPGARVVVAEGSLSGREMGQWIRSTIDGLALDPAVESSNDAFTHREIDVLRGLAGAQSNAAIADNLGISIRTVERHVHTIFGKLDVTNRTAAARWAIRNGLG
ncbi:MAG: hypothetical protein KC470_01455 [Dehalococcoidia bacterium]|nr:hypothetical protein [Dehalococcoidia bacterium]